jgi:hypothetical protein
MTTFILITILAITALAVLLRAVRQRNRAVGAAVAEQVQPLDIEAFRNLVDREEAEYLRRRLPSGKFRAVQRQRLLVAVDYVSCVGRNAAILLMLGENARQSPDQRIAEAGQRIVDSAIRLRGYALLARTQLYLAVLFPGLSVTSGRLPDLYQEASGSFSRLARLQDPVSGGRLSIAL